MDYLRGLFYYPLFINVNDKCERYNYPDDIITIINETHKYNGETNHICDDGIFQEYIIDNTVNVKTISDKVKNDNIHKVSTAIRRITYRSSACLFSTGSITIIGGCILHPYLTLIGILTLGSGIISGIYNYQKKKKLTKIINDWSSDPSRIRKNIPLHGFRSKYIYDNDLIDTYIHFNEAYLIWRHDISEIVNKFNMSRDDDKKIEFVKIIMLDNSLMTHYVKYFCLPEHINNDNDKYKQIEILYDKINSEYNISISTINKMIATRHKDFCMHHHDYDHLLTMMDDVHGVQMCAIIHKQQYEACLLEIEMKRNVRLLQVFDKLNELFNEYNSIINNQSLNSFRLNTNTNI